MQEELAVPQMCSSKVETGEQGNNSQSKKFSALLLEGPLKNIFHEHLRLIAFYRTSTNSQNGNMAGVTIYPSNQEPAALDPKARSIVKGQNETNFLEGIIRRKRGTVLQSSFGENASECIFPDNNGFVHSAMNAYNQHYHLKIRPEDIWLAVLTQLSCYINAHAEELRGSFVAHEGKKELKVYFFGTRFDWDWATFATSISNLLHENVVDPELREWMLPAFSTTTQQDKIVASVVMMASMQAYFSYGASAACGLPSVTLMGEKSDYELILHRLEKLRTYGEEPSQFADLLSAVVTRFIRSFEDPKNPDVLDFWNRIVSRWHLGSGMDYYSGWRTYPDIHYRTRTCADLLTLPISHRLYVLEQRWQAPSKRV